MDEPWPLEVYDRHDRAVNVTMEPGESWDHIDELPRTQGANISMTLIATQVIWSCMKVEA